MNFFVFESGLAEHNAAVKELLLGQFRLQRCRPNQTWYFSKSLSAQSQHRPETSNCHQDYPKHLLRQKDCLKWNFPCRGKSFFTQAIKTPFSQTLHFMGRQTISREGKAIFQGKYALRGEHVCFPGEANIHFSGILSNFRPEARNCLSPTRSATRNSHTKWFWK